MKKLLVLLTMSAFIAATLAHAQINTGPNNSITGTYSSIAGGNSNLINAPFSIVAGGQANTNTANYTAIGGGFRNVAETELGTIPGGQAARTRSYGQLAYSAGALSTAGDAQMGMYVLRGVTLNTTETEIFLDGSSQRITVPTSGSFLVEIDLVARGTTLVSGLLGNFHHMRFGVENQSGSLVLTAPLNYQGDGAGSGWADTFPGCDCTYLYLPVDVSTSTTTPESGALVSHGRISVSCRA